MLDAKELEVEIARLEYMESSYANYAKLADLYAIRNEMNRIKEKSLEGTEAPYAEEMKIIPAGEYGDSEFLQAISDKDAGSIWLIMNDLMETLKIAQPRAYNSVMRKIKSIADDYN